MVYTIWIYLLSIYSVLPVSFGQKLTVDPAGVYFYVTDENSGSNRIPVCIVPNSKLSVCAKDQNPVLTTVITDAEKSTKSHRSVTITPTIYPGYALPVDYSYSPNPYYVYYPTHNTPYVYSSNYPYIYLRTQTPVLKLTKTFRPKYDFDEDDDDWYDINDDDDDDLIPDKKKKKRPETYVFPTKYKRSIDKVPAVIPLMATGCVPANNNVCSTNQIADYSTYKQYRKMYKSNKQNKESLGNTNTDNVNYNTNTESNIPVYLPETDINVHTKKYARFVGNAVATLLQNIVPASCNIHINSVDIEVYKDWQLDDSNNDNYNNKNMQGENANIGNPSQVIPKKDTTIYNLEEKKSSV